MEQSGHAISNACLRKSPRQLHMRFLEIRTVRVARAAVQNTDQIDDPIHSAYDRIELRIVVNVTLHDRNSRVYEQLPGTGLAPGRHIDPVLGLDESANQVLTNKT